MGSPHGFPPEILDSKGDDVDNLLCVRCKFLIRNPVQSICGHRFCKDCIVYMIRQSSNVKCPACVEEGADDSDDCLLAEERVVPDHGVRREMQRMPVHCNNVGCQWRGQFKDYTEHIDKCEYKIRRCGECGAKVDVSRFEQHMQTECPRHKVKCKRCGAEMYAAAIKRHDGQCRGGNGQAGGDDDMSAMCPFECQQTDQKETLQEHMASHVNNHLVITLGKTHDNKQAEEAIMNQCSNLETRVSTVENEVAMVKGSMDMVRQQSQKGEYALQMVQRLEQHQPGIMYQQGATMSLPNMASSQQVQQVIEKCNMLEQVCSVLNNMNEKLETKVSDQDTQIKSLFQKFQSMERLLTLKDITIREMQLRVQGLECTSYNGTLIWRITDFKQKQKDAVEGRITSIFSPSFYTGRAGYKMCCRLYLNGDGSGRNSHLSLFFVVMRGPFDARLRWPFRPKVVMKLLDITEGAGSKTVSDSFKPDPNSSSFRKPTTDMNIASGFPMFMPLKELEDNKDRFIKEDQIFIAAQVDITGLEDV